MRFLQALAAAFALFPLLAACGDSSSLGGTPTPPPTATPDPLQTWLTPERRDLLLETMKELTLEAGWVAGCVFETKADQNVLGALKKPAGRAFFSEFTNPALGLALAARVEGTSAVTDFVGAAPNAQSYCFVPKP